MLFIPPSIPFMVPEAEASSHTADTTPPTITFLGFDDGMVHTRMATNSTGYNFLWHTYVTESNGANPSACHTTESSFPADTYYGPSMAQSVYNHLFPIGTTTVTCAATDTAGNTGTASFTITVLSPPTDTTPPTLTLPSGGTFAGSAGQFSNSTGTYFGYRYDFQVSATDDDPLSQAQPECQGHNAWGHYAGGGQVSDYDLPGTYSDVWNPTSSNRTFYFSGHAYFPVGTHYVTCTATDTSGNTESGTFVITVTEPEVASDTTPPTIQINLGDGTTGIADATAYTHTRTALNSTGYNFNWHTTVTEPHTPSICHDDTKDLDLVTDFLSHPLGPASHDLWPPTILYNYLFPVGTTTITCTTTDAAGNTGTASFTMIVTPPTDTTPTSNLSWTSLTITSSGGGDGIVSGETAHFEATLALEGDPPTDPIDVSSIVYHNFGSMGTAMQQFDDVDISSGTVTLSWDHYISIAWPLDGQYTVEFSVAPYAADNTITATSTICDPSNMSCESADNTIPTLTLPSDPASLPQFYSQNTAYGGSLPSGNLSWLAATTPTTFAGSFEGSAGQFSNSTGTYPGYVYNFQVFATDAGGLDYPPGGPFNTGFNPVCGSDVSGNVIISGTGAGSSNTRDFSGTVALPVGITSIPCMAVDYAGNYATGTFVINVTAPETESESADTVPPQVLVPNDITLQTGDQNGSSVTFNPQAIDNIDELITTTCSPASGSVFAIGTTEVVCTATDSSGNFSSNSFNVIIEYTGSLIPNWVKNVAGFWHDGSINDASFLGGISYLIQNNIIIVPTTESGSGGGAVPDWVKNTAGWWANDQIDDDTFVNAITYLIQQGLIQV